MLRSFSLLILLSACSFTLKHKGIPDNINVTAGPDFEKAAKFCDDRYGASSDAAESCFKDYRDYTKIKVEFDMSSLQDFCYKAYTVTDDQTKCITDITNAFDSILSGGN